MIGIAPRTGASADGATEGLLIFEGFEADRFQEHDALIVELVQRFNDDVSAGIGGTPEQAAQVPPLDPNLVKSWMIQESGGTPDAWAVDPLQINVPGDIFGYKSELGLTQATVRNTGTVEANLWAAIRFMARKGFGQSGQPVGNRPDGTFDGWETAIERYNGRTDRNDAGVEYKVRYAARIFSRLNAPTEHFPIEDL